MDGATVDAAARDMAAAGRDMAAADRQVGTDAPLTDMTAKPDLKPVFDPTLPFSAPIRLDTLSRADADEDDPTLTQDMLEILLECSDDVCRATRGSVDEPWSAPQVVESLSATPAEETAPELSTDGLTLWLSSNRNQVPPRTDVDIFVSSRQATDLPWSPPCWCRSSAA